MSGLEMLRKLREKCREPFVIMFSTLTEPGALATLDALMLGADDYITKPSNSGSLAESVETLRSELGAKILQFVQVGRTIGTGFTLHSSAADRTRPTIAGIPCGARNRSLNRRPKCLVNDRSHAP